MLLGLEMGSPDSRYRAISCIRYSQKLGANRGKEKTPGQSSSMISVIESQDKNLGSKKESGMIGLDSKKDGILGPNSR